MAKTENEIVICSINQRFRDKSGKGQNGILLSKLRNSVSAVARTVQNCGEWNTLVEEVIEKSTSKIIPEKRSNILLTLSRSTPRKNQELQPRAMS